MSRQQLICGLCFHCTRWRRFRFHYLGFGGGRSEQRRSDIKRREDPSRCREASTSSPATCPIQHEKHTQTSNNAVRDKPTVLQGRERRQSLIFPPSSVQRKQPSGLTREEEEPSVLSHRPCARLDPEHLPPPRVAERGRRRLIPTGDEGRKCQSVRERAARSGKLPRERVVRRRGGVCSLGCAARGGLFWGACRTLAGQKIETCRMRTS